MRSEFIDESERIRLRSVALRVAPRAILCGCAERLEFADREGFMLVVPHAWSCLKNLHVK